ncbi:site-specific integrase [Mycobacterium riyadhense]|uniref:site-specific integrase n=1 Tax=Mycobacterium riyadhense TaxID=486698 RepID=UPI0019593ED2|nr:site-specific integrase [Mycobacterium riyadhense]
MAAIKRYATAGGERWEVRYRQPNGITSRKRGFATKRDAEDWDAENRSKMNRGDFVSPSKGKVKVGDLAPAWLDRKKNTTEPSHSRMLDSAWRVHVEPVWGTVPVNKVTKTDVKNWSAAMTGAGCSATTVLRALGVLAGVLDDAIEIGGITKNPARGLDPKKREKPTKPKRKHVYLDHDDVDRLANESGQHRVLVLVLAYCGIRWGEAVALRVRHIDEVRRRLLVIDNAVQLGVDHAVGDPKGDEPREVPVPKFVMIELHKQIADSRRSPDDLVFGDGIHYLPRPRPDGWFAGAVKRAKVQRVTPHDLRHTAASLSVSAGASVLALARMLGHDDPSVTLRVYADLFDADLDKVGTALDAARRKSVSKRGPKRVQQLRTVGR